MSISKTFIRGRKIQHAPVVACIFVLSFLSLTTAVAQDSDPVTAGSAQVQPGPAEHVRRYLVELIIIKNEMTEQYDAEIWDGFAVSSATTEFARAPAILASPTPSSGTVEPGPSNTGHAFTALPPQVTLAELDHLANTYRVLQADPQYRVLQHAAWLQPIVNKKEAAVINISSLPATIVASSPGESTGSVVAANLPLLERSDVFGSIRIYENRLLFVEAQVSYKEPQTGSAGRYPAAQVETNHRPLTYNIDEKRRVKLNELHYLDHPFFGVLIRVSRWENKPAAKAH